MIRLISVLLLVLLPSDAFANQDNRNPAKRSYVCPPNFVRLSHRCYFFSKEKVTWQEAYFKCQSMHSNLAIVKNTNQDKLIRKTLSSRKLEPLERWIGGTFDWQQKQWKWAASGKPLTYDNFDQTSNQQKENLQWHCIAIDPEKQFRWISQSCFEKKHFICHKKIQTVTSNKSRKKLQQLYNSKKLNEVPIPDLSNDIETNPAGTNLKSRQNSDPFHIEIYPFALNAQPAYKKKERKNKTRKKYLVPEPALMQFSNGTVYKNNGNPSSVVLNDQPYRRRRNKGKDESQHTVKIYYKTYKENTKRKHPLHPKPIVEEYKLAKEG